MSIEKYAAECVVCKIDGEIKESLCPVCLTQRVFRGKWKIVIIWLLRERAMRFSELKSSIFHITQAYLSNQLKDLESDNLVIRKSYDEVPPRVEYSLTEEGRKFVSVIETINNWGADYLKGQLSGMEKE